MSVFVRIIVLGQVNVVWLRGKTLSIELVLDWESPWGFHMGKAEKVDQNHQTLGVHFTALALRTHWSDTPHAASAWGRRKFNTAMYIINWGEKFGTGRGSISLETFPSFFESLMPPHNAHVPNKFRQCVLFQPKQNSTAGICTVTLDSIFSSFHFNAKVTI